MSTDTRNFLRFVSRLLALYAVAVAGLCVFLLAVDAVVGNPAMRFLVLPAMFAYFAGVMWLTARFWP